MPELNRRRFVTGSTVLAVSALAGCAGGSGGSDGGDGGDDTPTPTEGGGGGSDAEGRAVDYLNADPAAENFGGSVMDMTGQDTVSVDVGAEGNGGNFAFSPVAIRISAGTTVSWEWTGEGGQHNVVSEADSDFDFDSGNPKTSGDPFTQSFDDTGAGLYFCEPHRGLGMKGALVVVE